MPSTGRTLDRPTLETWLWDAACAIRGPVDAPKFKDYILPLIFLKRLSDVFEDEVARLTQELGPETAKQVMDDRTLFRFYLPEETHGVARNGGRDHLGATRLVWAGDQPLHLRHRPHERFYPRHGRPDRAGRHHAPPRLHP